RDHRARPRDGPRQDRRDDLQPAARRAGADRLSPDDRGADSPPRGRALSGLRPFALHRPSTLAEAAEVLAREGSHAALYAGGTELLLILKEGLLRVQSLIDVKGIRGLSEIHADDGHVIVGATTTHRAVERSEIVQARCPLIARVARHVANIRVRSVGTVGGNLAFADPHSDLATVFLTFDAVVRLVSRAGERE